MAVRDLLRTGAGALANITEIKTFTDCLTSFQNIVRKINGGISMGDGLNSSLAGNLDAQIIDWTFADANVEYEIPHSLGRIVVGYEPVRKDRACDIYDSNAGQWSPTALFLKCSVAGATVKFRIH